MKYWVITDTHLGHGKMEEYCGRPHNFETKILESLICVQESDVLIHLGDVCIGHDTDWHGLLLSACRGKTWLIKGNHDRKSNSWYMDNGWDFVADSVTVTLFGMRIAFSHRPITVHTDFDINIHGHHHNTLHHPEDQTTTKHKLVCIEHGYAPVTLQQLLTGTKCV